MIILIFTEYFSLYYQLYFFFMFSKDSINKVGLGENLIKANQNLICFPENNHMKDTYMVLIQSYVRL